VVFLSVAAVAGAGAGRWRDALAGWGHPLVVCLAPAAARPAPASEADRRIGLLAIEQAAWAFCDGDARFGVAGSRTELDWALKTGRLSAWAPSRMATAALHRPVPDASDPGGLAAWLARELEAEMLVVAGAPPAGAAVPVRIVRNPEDLPAL
jgi:dihydroneopterin aldolase